MNRQEALSSVGKGWARIINNLYDAKPKTTLVIQVKEKFGGLRFYVGSAPDWYFDLIIISKLPGCFKNYKTY